ncbi:DUF4351 domain-containing protein [Candidatus Synechococcus calcipolaris G9]|uniref:DUF4351 domain-containing protein n=1 Tax=Candidatus Synechococcus calcipolaris G9 TaxID=1497997 RepID=A0ABT6EZ52_9SYNE|nr:DUF4351 domain-containing protein [Candidatus Synechococcus calcipolaris]MDG2990843.1 DUF4351 domain-containing protein [Candidatus Synechococcus calcipolaris G9]
MLGLQAEDLSHTRFYHDVFREGESQMIICQLRYKMGSIDFSLESQIKSLSSEQLDLLGKALLNFEDVEELQAWSGLFPNRLSSWDRVRRAEG